MRVHEDNVNAEESSFFFFCYTCGRACKGEIGLRSHIRSHGCFCTIEEFGLML